VAGCINRITKPVLIVDRPVIQHRAGAIKHENVRRGSGPEVTCETGVFVEDVFNLRFKPPLPQTACPEFHQQPHCSPE
jgi:hypothetical protein